MADLEMARDDRPPLTFYAHFSGRSCLLQHVPFFLAVAGAANAPSVFSGDGPYRCALPSVVCRRGVETYALLRVHFACFDYHCGNRADHQIWIAVYEQDSS